MFMKHRLKEETRILLTAGYTWLQQSLFKNRPRYPFITQGFKRAEELRNESSAHW
jgi:hypothetical protein